MRLLVTGASGFVGAHFCLHAAGRHALIGVHHATGLALPGLEPARIDLRDPRAAAKLRALKPDWIVHFAFKVKGGDAAETNARMMDAVLGAGVPVAYASSTVVHWARPTAYGAARLADEARLRASGLPHVILRPSAPYGPRLLHHRPAHRESFETLARLVRLSPVVPLIGDGHYRRQPVHVRDLAEGALRLMALPEGAHAYDIGGADALSFREIIRTLGAVVGRAPRLLPVPKSVFVALARRQPNFDPELIDAVDADELADPGPLVRATGLRVRPFAEGAPDLMR